MFGDNTDQNDDDNEIEVCLYDNDIHLMVSIFQEVFQFTNDVLTDSAEYIKRHESQIKKAGQVFGYLRLAEADTASPIGWRPTRLLMGIIAKRVSTKQRPRSVDEITSELILEAIYRDIGGAQGSELSDATLAALGFLRDDTFDLDWRVTQPLKKLFRTAYILRCAKKLEEEDPED